MTRVNLSRKEILDMVGAGELDSEEGERLLLALDEDGSDDGAPPGEATAALPPSCPSCGEELVITRARCSSCDLVLDGRFAPCTFCQLGREHRSLLFLFLKTRGNLKEIGRAMGLSYPTVRSRLEGLLLSLGVVEKEELSPLSVIKALRDGKVSVNEAVKLLGKR